MSARRMAGIVAGILLLAGCGGSGGITVPPTARTIVTNTLRTFTNGDSIQYSLAGSVNAGGVTASVIGTASYTITLNSSPPDPTGTVRSVAVLAITGVLPNGTPVTSNGSEYFRQSPTGTKNTYGNSVSGWITVPASGFVPTIISPIVAPASWLNTFTQQNGDVTSSRISVIGKANIATGMGVFETYQYQSISTMTLAAGGTRASTTTSYVVPAIGPLKMTINITATSAAGAITTSQFTLTAITTNIPF